MNFQLFSLEPQDVQLYADMCESNGIVPWLTDLTKRQVDILISLRKNGVYAKDVHTEQREWIIPGKKKQGGHLIQKTVKKFFLPEN